ncbi:MAG: Maf family protein [Candidatus Acidiferrales bacterium]
MKHLILASRSLRRQEVLRNAGFEFEVIPSQVEENPLSGETPAALVERLARLKAQDVAAKLGPRDDALVLGADTVVVNDGALLGKPQSSQEAAAMLERLSGNAHEVVTGVALAEPGRSSLAVAHEITRVFFRPLTRQEISDYIASGEPLDKAGAYAIQGRAGRFVTRVEGCYFNVVGLPVALVDRLLREWTSSKA